MIPLYLTIYAKPITHITNVKPIALYVVVISFFSI